MFLNFIIFILCAAFAVFYGINGNVGFCILESALALFNLPFAIKWLKSYFKCD